MTRVVLDASSEQATSAGTDMWSHGAGIPSPVSEERPTVYADRFGECYVASKSEKYRKEHGLYLTPVPVADFMARRIGAPGPAMNPAGALRSEAVFFSGSSNLNECRENP